MKNLYAKQNGNRYTTDTKSEEETKRQDYKYNSQQTHTEDNTNAESANKGTEKPNGPKKDFPKKSKFLNLNSYVIIGAFVVLVVVVMTVNQKKKEKTTTIESTNTGYNSYSTNQPPAGQEIQKEDLVPSYQQDNGSSNQSIESNELLSSGKSYFTIGSTKDEVLQIQGTPSSIDKYDYTNEETWWYGSSRVTLKNGRVKEYSNTRNNLRIKL